VQDRRIKVAQVYSGAYTAGLMPPGEAQRYMRESFGGGGGGSGKRKKDSFRSE